MIEPKEKAIELVEKFSPIGFNEFTPTLHAKQCALIAVNEIIESLEHHSWQNRHWLGYYDDVKQEIEKL